jgi:hypothetical protein
MSIIKRVSLKIFITISILLSLIAILLITISALLTTKPQTGLLIIDKVFLTLMRYHLNLFKLIIYLPLQAFLQKTFLFQVMFSR